jgi:segregation and condensation protein B
MVNMSQEKILEAALFMSARPLMLDELGKILGVNSLGYVKEMLEKLQKDYSGKGIEIVNTPQGWVMQVRQEFLGKVAHLTPYADMSEGCKRTLAIIAYKEPVQQSEIIKIQGNKAYTYLKHLQKRNLVKAEKKGRTKMIKLTQEFERYFGEEKEKIKEKLGSFQKADSRKSEKKEKASAIQQPKETEPSQEPDKREKASQNPSDAFGQANRPKKKSDIDSILS